LYLTFEKNRESKTIDKQIDRLIQAIAEANRKAALEKAKARALALKSNASLKKLLLQWLRNLYPLLE
jgi:hypothetical protein